MDTSSSRARPYRIAYAILFLAAAAFLLYFFARIVLLSSGNVLNNYPAISSDGYDWLTEGLYVSLFLKHTVAARALPVLRPPVFVLVTTLDAFAGQRGYAIAAANVLAWGATIICAYRVIDSRESSDIRDDEKYLIAMLIVGLLTVAPINYFRMYVLSDGLCIGLAMASYYFYHRYVTGGTNGVLVGATLLAILAGSTQTYGLIPPLAASAIGIFALSRSRQFPVVARLLLTSVMLVVATVIFRAAWLGSFEHVIAPKPFDLFELRFSMSAFYLNAWSIYLLPVLPVLAVSILLPARLLTVLRDDLVFLSSAMVTVTFAGLCFFYQWPEARFTLFFWPWLVVLAGRLLLGFARAGFRPAHRQTVILAAGALLFFNTFFVYPQNYWRPRWTQMEAGPRGSWLAFFARTLPVDRLQLRQNCGSPARVCAAARRLEGFDRYPTQVVDFYLALTRQSTP